MEHLVNMSQPAEVAIGATGVPAILQCVRTILSTVKGSVPLDRDFGVSATFLDNPLPEAMAAYTGEVVDEVERQEPRVVVTQVEFQARVGEAMDGRLYPVVRVKIKEGVLDG